MNLEQMSYRCPGLHGPGTRQDISRQTFAQVLEKYPKLIIPLFQRRYCWTEIQFEKWWNDVHHGERDYFGQHCTGKVRVKPNENQELIIIDGQQRFTTTIILLATLRNRMKNHKEANKYLMNGDDYRLIPSYLDRPAFYSIIKNDSVNNHDIASYQWKAYHYFNRKNETLNDNDIEEMFINALHKMSVMLVVIVNEVNMGQIYLWLQEKSLFGMGSLLINLSPGENLTGGDMVRNLVMAAVADEALETQEQFYFQYWLKPIEEKLNGSVTDFLFTFVQKFDFDHEAKSETYIRLYLKDKPKEEKNLLAYGRFYSLYEWKLKIASESKDLLDVDQECVIRVTKELLCEMAKELL